MGIACFSMTLLHAQGPIPQLGKNSIKEVVAAMTLEEKARLVVGMGFKMPALPKSSTTDAAPKAQSKEGFTLPPDDPEAGAIPDRVPGAAGRTHAIPRLGIPSLTVCDGPAGIRIDPYRKNDSSVSYFATAWPTATLLASTWDTSMVQRVGVGFGEEIRDYGSDLILGPGMNIQRNPLGGRNFEYYSEDPLLSGNMAAAIVNGIQSNGVGTSIKHFVANNSETNRSQLNTLVSERSLREIYLRGFQIAVQKSDPWTVMSSYNKINGIYTSERPDLLTGILRNEWGFRGMVMTDWFGGHDAVAQIKAGNDLLMPGSPGQSKAIVDAVNAGQLDVSLLDRDVEKILQLVLLSPTFKQVGVAGKTDLLSHAAIVREAASEGMVLIKNKNTLPVKNGKKIALFGNNAYDLIAGGTGSGDVNKAYTISTRAGLEDAGYKLDKDLTDAYTTFIAAEKLKQPAPAMFFLPKAPIPEMIPSAEMIARQVDKSDLGIYSLGRSGGEGVDRNVENDFLLSSVELGLIRQLSAAFHAKGKKLVILLNIGGVIETKSWENLADAILIAWQPGQEGGHSIADVLSGKVNPSGRLAVTFPVKYEDVASSKNFPGHLINPADTGFSIFGHPAELTYDDGIYVGYRYYNSFHLHTAYPFGFGLSYSSFKYSDLWLSSPSFGDGLSVSVKVTNTGKLPGKEVVQLYLTAPKGNLDKPSMELKAFAKTGLLMPGKSQVVRFSLDPMSLASFDPAASAWVAAPGSYLLRFASSAENILLSQDFMLDQEWKGPVLQKAFAPEPAIREMKQ